MREDFKFRIQQDYITPKVEKHLQRLRDIGVEVIIEPKDSMCKFGGLMPVKYEREGDWYPEDVYEILQPLYAELVEI